MGLEKEAHYLKNNYRFNNSVDVGSNTGHFTNMLSKISKKVYSFEPIYYLNKSQKYLFKDTNVLTHNIALGSTKQKRKFYIPKNNEAESSLIKKENSKITSVIVNKGDNIIKGVEIDFIKIDVEGSELDTLIGLKKTIKQCLPFLLIEIEKRHNTKFIMVFKFLKKYKYKVYYLNKKNMKLVNLQTNKLKHFFKKYQNYSQIGTEKYVNNFFFKQD